MQVAAAGLVSDQNAADVMLAVTPFFHITGMQMAMNNASQPSCKAAPTTSP